jgi:TetR/AcrR family transcriptional regulator, ethionamide resistance regulator
VSGAIGGPATVRGQERRTAVLDALERLLRDRPLAAVDVAQLSAEAGLTRSGFYFYFPTKEAAVEALLWDVFEQMGEAAAGFLDGDGPPAAVVERSLRGVAELWERHEHLLAAMLVASATDAGAAAAWERWLAAWVERVARAVEEQRAAGRAPAGPPAHDLAGVLIGMNVHAFSRPGPPPLEALVHTWQTTIYGAPA